MSNTVTTEAIRKTVLVDFSPAEAFELFTTRVSSWWPTETHSYAHDKVTDVIFDPRVGGLLYEVTDEGTAEWATDHGLGAATSARAGVADRQGVRHRGGGDASPRRGRDRESSSSIEGGTRPRRDPRVRGATAAAGTPCWRPYVESASKKA